eukprot:1163132-Pyramimonas_sp.AAC.2
MCLRQPAWSGRGGRTNLRTWRRLSPRRGSGPLWRVTPTVRTLATCGPKLTASPLGHATPELVAI